MPVSNIPWNKYTHINHFAASTPGNGTVALYYLNQAEIDALVTSKPVGKKVLVTIKDNDTNSRAMAASTAPLIIDTFVSNIVNFVNSNGYDGVDIDWEQDVSVSRYVDLVARLRTAMPEKVITMDAGNWSSLETIAASSHPALDQINVMCYDMDNGRNCNGRDCTWYNSALSQNGQSDRRTCDWRVRSFTNRDVPNSKIGIGLPFYGRRWMGVSRPEVPGSFVKRTMFYRDLATDRTRWQPEYQAYDSGFKSNYLSIPALNEFISYTGAQSIRDAAEWQKAQGFGGFMVFALEYEYIAAATGDSSHPLSTILYSEAFGEVARSPKPRFPRPANFRGPSKRR